MNMYKYIILLLLLPLLLLLLLLPPPPRLLLLLLPPPLIIIIIMIIIIITTNSGLMVTAVAVRIKQDHSSRQGCGLQSRHSHSPWESARRESRKTPGKVSS